MSLNLDENIQENDVVDSQQQLESPKIGTPVNESSVASDIETDNTDVTTEKETSSVPTPLPSLKDLPSLVSKDAFANTKVNWGPNMKPAPFVPMSSSANSSTGSLSNAKRMKSKNIQESFSLDLQSQLSVTKQELSKIILSVRQNWNVSVESTLSKNARIFLISGTVEDIRDAKRELVRKLTRPIDSVIEIPAKCRAAIIGSGGKTIREISSKYDVRINVAKENNENSYDEELDDFTANVSLFGDFESVKQATEKIMAIVKEDTKNTTAKVSIKEDFLIPFFDFEDISGVPESIKSQFSGATGEIAISGLREDVQATRIMIQKYLDQLSLDITEQKVKIPKKFQFLIDEKILKSKFNVLVAFPTDLDDDFVSFSGREGNVKEAIDFARSSSKAYIVDALDISKSHSKNIEHARNLMLYFSKYPVLEAIEKQHPTVKIILPTAKELETNKNEVAFKISAKSEDSTDIKNVRKELISMVNSITPADTLAINDLDYELFHKSIYHILLNTEEEYPFIQLGDFYPGNDSVVIFRAISGEDFKPSTEEIREELVQTASQLEPLRTKLSNMSTHTFDIDAHTQESLFSKSSTTLALILEEISNEDGHVQFKLNTPEQDKMTIRGDSKIVKNVTKIVDEILANPSPKSKLTFDIPANSAARLIGTKGSNLQSIRQKYDCTLDVEHQNGNNKEPVEVTLTGPQFNIECAKKFISVEVKKWADIITKELIVPQKLHRNLIGPNGSYRTRLQDKYSVFINFPRDSDIVTIRGPSRGVKQAYEELSALLDFERENGHTLIKKVPAEHVPRVIGKNGDVINDIRAEFGVEMDFLQKASDEEVKESGEVELKITGTRTAIKEAGAKVDEIVDAAANFTKETMEVDHKYHRGIIGAGGSTLREIVSKAGGDEIKNKGVDIPNADQESNTITIQGPESFVNKVISQIKKIVQDAENSDTKTIEVPKERYGALIGPGGMVRRQLETEFSVTLNIPNKNETGAVSITGLPENIEKAEKKIFTEILKDDFDLELEVPASIHTYVSERGAFIQKLRMDDFINIRHGNSSRRANHLNRASLDIPAERVSPISEEEKAQKIKVTIEEVGEPRVESENGMIPWRLTYEPIDISAILAEDDEESSDKKENPNKASVDEGKKKEALAKAQKAIEDRIASVSTATYVGYVWSSDVRRFNKIVGPGGSQIKKIRNATGVLINVPRKSDKVNDIVYIRGTKEGVEKAAEMVTKSIKN